MERLLSQAHLRFQQNSRRIFFLVLTGIILFSDKEVSAAHFGGLGGAFLRSPVGATGFALGGALTASPEYLCVWWNPAALADLKKRKLSIGLGYRPLGRTDGSLNFEFPIPTRMAMGLSILYRGDPFINGLVNKNEEELETMAYTTLTGKIGVSYVINRRLALGLNFSIFYQSLPTDFDENKKAIYSTTTALGGFDAGLRYVLNKKLTYGLVFKNLLTLIGWQYASSGLNILAQDTIPVSIALGQRVKTTFLGKPFAWTCDVIGYVFNGYFRQIDHSHVVINNGVEWQRWNMLALRLGIRDIEINRDIYAHTSDYFDYFSLAFSLGFMLDLSSTVKGKDMKFNYGFSNSKAGAGIDQQLDFIYAF